MGKQVKVIDTHEQYKKLNKASKVVLKIGTVFGLVSAVSLITVSVLALCGVFNMPISTVRKYECSFQSYNGNLLFYAEYKRGETIEYIEFDTDHPDDFDGTTYTFIGWDITGDLIPDILPTRMYYSFYAKPIYFEFNPHGSSKDDDGDPEEMTKEVIYYAS